MSGLVSKIALLHLLLICGRNKEGGREGGLASENVPRWSAS